MDTATATQFAFQILPVVYAGLALALIGIALIAAEFHLPTFGLLGMLGLLVIVAGYVILLHADSPGVSVALPVVAAVGVVGAVLVPIAIYMTIRSRGRPVVTGESAMLGARVEVAEDFAQGRGRVHYRGEWWNARSAAPLRIGDRARVVAVDGLELTVEPV